MGDKRRWDIYQEWYELLDAVCIDQNHFQNMGLASELCAASGNKSGAAFDAALKNLRNWREGSHVPQRRNYLLLTEVLRIDSYENLLSHWAHLYTNARKSTGGEANANSDVTPGPLVLNQGTRFSSPQKMKALLAATGIVCAVIVVAASYLFQAGFEVSAQGVQSADVEYRKEVILKVGEAIVVHGARAACEGTPPAWEKIVAKLPELEIGNWSDGNVGTRYSRKCGGPTLARGIIFNATKPGVSEITLFGDPVKIQVN